MQLLKLQLLHERALHRGQLKVAQQVCDDFGVLASFVTGVDMEIKTEASLRHTHTLLSANQFSQLFWHSLKFGSLGSTHAKRASSLVHKTLPTILGHGGLELRARANITLAKCYLSDPCFSVYEMAAEAFFLMAVVYNGLEQLEEREKEDLPSGKHVMAYENLQYEEDQLLCSL